MVSIKNLFLFPALFTIALADDLPQDVKIQPRVLVHEANLSSTFDKVLPELQRYITNNGFDPMEIPDMEIPLSIIPELLKTKMLLHHGYMQELSTIYRAGDIILQWTNKKLSLYLNVGFETLDLSYEYSLRYMLYHRKGDCYGRYHDVKASMLVDVDLEQMKIDLKFFKFLELRDFTLKLEGHFADKLLNILTKAIITIFKKSALRIIEWKTYEEISKHIEDLNEVIPEDFLFILKKIIKDLEDQGTLMYRAKEVLPS